MPLPPNPLLVEITRGDLVESRHRGSVAVVDARGAVQLAIGDIERPVYARSGLKPIQALPLIETGAADAFVLCDAEIALACASHSGAPRHVALVGDWLAKLGLGAGDLECSANAPIRDNCSGKHTGFLSVARHLGVPTAGYIRHEHPVQQRVLDTLSSMTGLDLSLAPRAIDGCGIPTIGIPLRRIALAMARLADPRELPAARAAACGRIRRAMAAEPFLVAGEGRCCTRVIEALGEAALVKTGAEGVYCAALGGLGLGLALKIDDGATRAAEAVLLQTLQKLAVITESARTRLGDLLDPTARNRAGRAVGQTRVVERASRV